MSEKRKQALVVYLAALFGLAFIIVTVSLVVQVRKGNDPNLANAVTLQAQVQELSTQNKQLSADYEKLREQIDALTSQKKDDEIQALENKLNACSHLIAAQDALLNQDAKALKTHLEILEDLQKHLDKDQQKIYEALLDATKE